MLQAYQTSRVWIGRPVARCFPLATSVLPLAFLDWVAATGLVVVGVLIASLAHATDVPTAGSSGKYQFDRTISREVFENYLARSI